MATALDKPLKREILIGRVPYVLIVSPDGLKITLKGRRNGLELAWEDFVNGEAALATALNASLARTLVSLRSSAEPRPASRPRRSARSR